MRTGTGIAAYAAVLFLLLLPCADAMQGVGPAEAARERAFAEAVEATAQPGDLIFISAGGTWSDLARFLSRHEQLYSHVGVVARENGHLVVIHAGGNPIHSEAGVHADSVLWFMNTVTRVGLYRMPANLLPKFLAYVEGAKARHLPFDSDFSLDTPDQLYCTELVWRGLMAALGRDPIPVKGTAVGNPYVALDDVTSLPFLSRVPLAGPARIAAR